MRILFILLAIYFLYRLFFNVILPMAAKHLFNKASQSMNGSFQQQQNRRREGEVRIEPKKDSYRADDGEYVDYTEVK